MTKTYSPMPFPVHLRVTSRNGGAPATALLEGFIAQAAGQHELAILSPTSGTATTAEATISVPFAERERIRIGFNIYASEMDDAHGPGLHFHMESAFEG